MKKIFVLGELESAPNYYNALRACGAQVVFGKALSDAYGCDGLLLTGGADLNPATYSEENTASEGIDDLRDSSEIELVKCFSEQNKPILGICRGLQLINVAFGGSLIQNLEQVEHHSRCGADQDKVHEVRLSGPSFLTALYGESFFVNSWHHQAVKIPADGFMVVAYSDDGVVEALVHEEKPIVAVQWHPERMAFDLRRPDTVDGRPIFEYFLSLIP